MRDVMLIFHFIGLAMGVGTGFAQMFLGIARNKMSDEESERFALHSLVLGMMGKIGLTLLIISGGALMTPYWSELGTMPLLIAKLVLVVVLTVIIGMIAVQAKKAKQNNGGEALKKIENLGKLSFPVGLAIVILAVLVFH